MKLLDRLSPLAKRVSGGRPLLVTIVVSVALVATGLAAVVIRSDDGLRPGQVRLQPDGRVEVSIRRGGFDQVGRDVVLASGDRVRVASGRALLELPGSAAAEMRAGSALTVGGGDRIDLTLDSGDLLVQVEESTVVVDGGSAEVTVGAGVSKIRRSASLVAGVYEGSLLLSGPGRSLSVSRLRQAAVVGLGRLPGDVRPLALSDRDSWDRRLLGPVLELDHRLVAFGRGFEALLGDPSSAPSLFVRLLPQLEATIPAAVLSRRSAGENLIGLSLVSMAQGSLDERIDRVFGLRDQGARWGLVAADGGFAPDDVVRTVEAAIDRAPLQIASPAPSGSPAGGSVQTPPSSGGSTPPGGPGGPGGGGGGGGSSTTTTSPLIPPIGGSTTTTAPPSGECVLKLGEDFCLL